MTITKVSQINNKYGIHARPTAIVVDTAKKFDANIFILRGEDRADAKSMLDILSLNLKEGDQVSVEADGNDAEEAVSAIAKVLSKTFDFIPKN